MEAYGYNQGLSQDFKMPDRNSYHKIFACPNLAAQLLQILVPGASHLIVYYVKKGNFHFSSVLEDSLLRKYMFIT